MNILKENLDNVNFHKNELNNDTTFLSTFKILGKLLLVNSLFLIFNNAQLSIILTFVNKKYPKDEILTNSIGTVNTLMNLLIYPFILGIAAAFEILGSQAFSLKKFNLFSFYLTNLRFIGNCFIVFISFLIFFFHKNIFDLWNIEAEVQYHASKLIFIRFFSVLFEFEIYFKIRYLQIINKSSDALVIITVNGFLLPLFAYVFIILFDLHAFGCGLVYLFNNVFMLISLVTYIRLNKLSEKNLVDLIYNRNSYMNIKRTEDDIIETNSSTKIIISEENNYAKKTTNNNANISHDFNSDIVDKINLNEINEDTDKNLIVKEKQIKEKICSENSKFELYYLDEENKNKNKINEEESLLALFGFIIPLFLISLMDNLSVEAMSIFANYFEAKEYSDFLNAYSLYGLVGTISLSFNSSASIIISSNYGTSSGKKIKKLFYNILSIGVIISFFLGSLLFLFSDSILNILLQTSEIGSNTKQMFHLSILCNMIDVIQYILLSALKSFGYIYLGFFVYFASNLMNFLMIYFFAFNTEMKIYGIFFGYLINEIVTVSMYFFVFFFFVSFNRFENKKN